jgi:hypothetical protein
MEELLSEKKSKCKPIAGLILMCNFIAGLKY